MAGEKEAILNIFNLSLFNIQTFAKYEELHTDYSFNINDSNVSILSGSGLLRFQGKDP
jgi:hypothetical protein